MVSQSIKSKIKTPKLTCTDIKQELDNDLSVWVLHNSQLIF